MGIKKGSLSYLVLDVLEKSVDAAVRVEDFTNKTHLYAYRGRSGQNLSKSALSQALGRLKKSGMIEDARVDNKLLFKLTQGGKDLIPELLGKEYDWDGKWRMVVFDIPESKRIVRNLFRRNLKKWGFKPLQKSVWVSKRDCYQRLNSYIADLGIKPWVVALETDKISIS